jgi:hypothetical protein
MKGPLKEIASHAGAGVLPESFRDARNVTLLLPSGDNTCDILHEFKSPE